MDFSTKSPSAAVTFCVWFLGVGLPLCLSFPPCPEGYGLSHAMPSRSPRHETPKGKTSYESGRHHPWCSIVSSSSGTNSPAKASGCPFNHSTHLARPREYTPAFCAKILRLRRSLLKDKPKLKPVAWSIIKPWDIQPESLICSLFVRGLCNRPCCLHGKGPMSSWLR